MADGVFQTDRSIFSHCIWKNIVEFRLFFYVYGNAVFAEEGVRKGNVTIRRGQYLRSYRGLQEDLEYVENRAVKRYSTSMIKRAVDNLVNENRLQIEHTEVGTLFTVVNYTEYQGFQRFSNGKQNADGTATEQQRNNNKNVKKEKNGLEVQSLSSNKESLPIVEIVEFLNTTCGKNYKASTGSTRDKIQARWNEGWRLEHFQKVIRNKASQWKDDSRMNKYLRPETLFGTKFESYLNEASSSGYSATLRQL